MGFKIFLGLLFVVLIVALCFEPEPPCANPHLEERTTAVWTGKFFMPIKHTVAICDDEAKAGKR